MMVIIDKAEICTVLHCLCATQFWAHYFLKYFSLHNSIELSQQPYKGIRHTEVR